MNIRPKMTRADRRRHFDAVVSFGCTVRDKHCGGRLTIHHVRLILGESRKDDQVICLCEQHHQHGPRGVAYHNGMGVFSERYGTQLELLEAVRERLAQVMPEGYDYPWLGQAATHDAWAIGG